MQAGNAENFYDVFTNMKIEKITQRRTGSFFCPAIATHLKGSQVRTHPGPDLSEASRKKKPSSKERGKLLRRWGSVVVGQVGPNVKMNVKCKPTSTVDVHRCSFSPVGFDPHLCQADSKSGTAPAVQLAHPTNCNLSQRTTFEPAAPAR